MAVLVALLLVGCVTTETGVFTEKRDPQKAVQLAVEAAKGYIQRGNWEAAKRHLRSALKSDPDNAEVHEALGLVFQNTGEFELAGEHFRRAVAIDGSARIRNNYAAYLYQRAEYEKAEAQLEKVVEDTLYDARPQAFVNLGLVRMRLKRYEQARDAFERARLMERRNPLTLFQLAEVNYQLGELAEAQKFYSAYRKQVPRQTAGSLWLGIRLADKFGDRNAMASYALALKNLFPRSEEYLEYQNVYGGGVNGNH